jgi:hypothetical protein
MRTDDMKRLALVLVLLAAAPAAAPAAGCSPDDCSPTGSLLGHGLFAIRPQGVSGSVVVVDLRNGHTKWQLPAGVLAGRTVVADDAGVLSWFDVVDGRRKAEATLKQKRLGELVGASQDGRRAVLEYSDRHQTRFTIASPQARRTIRLSGSNWGFDALADHNLFLLRYLRNGYEVRRYDLAAGRLVPAPLKDPHESSLIWGTPWGRTASPDGRYLFTLYVGQNGGAMVHELDVRRAVARCIDLPGTGDFNKGTSYALQLAPDGRTLWAVSPGYGRVVGIDVRSARVRVAFRFRATRQIQGPSTTVATVAPRGNRIAVALGRELWLISTTTHAVRHRWRAANAVAFSTDGSRLFVVRGQVVRALAVA